MRKSITLMLSASILLIVASCKKSINNDTPNSKSCKLTQISDSFGDKTYISYNSDHKLSRIDYGTNPSNDFDTFSYSNNMITSYYEYPTSSGKETGTANFTLDASGRIISARRINGDSATFTYDSNGYLTSGIIVDEFGTKTMNYTWSNGNLTKITSPDGRVINIEYGNDISSDPMLKSINLPRIYTEYYNFDISQLVSYMGKTSTNLISSLSGVGSSSTWKESYTYTKDSDGKIVKLVMASKDGNSSTEEYTYTCN